MTEDKEDEAELLPVEQVEEITNDSCFNGNREFGRWLCKTLKPIAIASDDENIAVFTHMLMLLMLALTPFVPIWGSITVAVFAYFWYVLRIVRRFKPERELFFRWVAKTPAYKLACYLLFSVLTCVLSIIASILTRRYLRSLFIVTAAYSGASVFVVGFAHFARDLIERKKISNSMEDTIRLTRLRTLLTGDGTMKHLVLDVKYQKAIWCFMRSVKSVLVVTTVDGDDEVVDIHSDTSCVQLKYIGGEAVYRGEITVTSHSGTNQVRLTFSPPIKTSDFKAALYGYVASRSSGGASVVSEREIDPVV